MDQLGRYLIISSHHNLFANLPSGNATWHNALIVLCVCRELGDDQDETQDHLDQRIHEDQQCSLGHLNSL
jgi:hypothetical protein